MNESLLIGLIAGAIGGAYAGNKVQERIQRSRTIKTVEKQCETVYEPRELPVPEGEVNLASNAG